MIELRDIHKTFDGRGALRGITLIFSDSRVTGILGPNSCGKTTLLKSILGLVLPERGDIRVDGQPLSHAGLYRADIGYMSQTTSFPDNLRTSEIFRLLEDLRGKSAPRKNALIERLGLRDLLGKPFGALSGGARQRVGAVVAMMFDPRTLILDEPTASLDPLAAIAMRQLLADESRAGKSLLLVSHVLSEIEALAQDIVLMNEGRVVHASSVQELLDQGASLESSILERFRQKEVYR